jgi:hypothetical protein
MFYSTRYFIRFLGVAIIAIILFERHGAVLTFVRNLGTTLKALISR